MAISIIGTPVDSGRQPSAPLMSGRIRVTLDTSYPTGGYDITASLPPGITVIPTAPIPHYDGSALRWLQISSVGKVQAFVSTNGAPGAETTAAVNVSGHANVDLFWTGY